VTGTMRRWPLFLIAAPAAVAIWSGWVGLGGMCGFGLVQPLPGIAPWHLNTAITLPVGVESYAAFALDAWLTPAVAEGARRFAKWSALGAIALGMTGQVAYHLLTSAHAAKAPTVVVVLVSCMPVVTFAMAVWLAHMLRSGAPAPETDTAVPEPPASLNGQGHQAAEIFSEDLARGEVPGIRRIRKQMHVGQPRAQAVREYLAGLANGHGEES
jgi:hypothetical protein